MKGLTKDDLALTLKECNNQRIQMLIQLELILAGIAHLEKEMKKLGK